MNKLYWTACLSILRKEVIRILRIWPQTLLPSLITTALYFLVFGNLIGNRIGEIQGIPYIQFILPGLIMMATIMNSYNNVSSSFFSAKFQRNIEVILSAPVPEWAILIGYVGGGIFRGLTIGLMIWLLSLSFIWVVPHQIGVVIFVIVLTSFTFSIAGFINAIFATKFDDVSIVPIFALTPLTYLGGVFYSTEMLPEFFRKISYSNPLLYIINAFRYGILGVSDIPIASSLAILSLFAVLLTLFAFFLLKRGTGLKA